MSKSKIAITMDTTTISRLDQLIRDQFYANRSQAIEEAVREKLSKLRKTRLARECAKLNPREEQALAEEGILEDSAEWPEY